MRMAVRKMRAPPQTTNIVNIITPAKPAQGCQAGMVTGEVIRSVITIGVNGGINDITVENVESGSFKTGIMINIGIIMGNMAGKDKD